ncbi:phage major capsid protein, partial [Cutibacterium acnes]
DEIRALDVKIAAEDEGAALRNGIGGNPPTQHYANGKAVDGGYGGAPAGRLDFRGLGAAMTDGMLGYSARVAPGTKGLVPSGESVLPLPVVAGGPIPSAVVHESAPRLVDLLPVTVRSAVYRYLRQAVIASPGGAGVVAPGDVKPTKKLGVEAEDARLRVVAVLSEPIDKFLLEDAANLRTWVGVELADAIRDALETEVLTGDGTGEHLLGLANTSGIQTQAYATDRITTIAAGLARLSNIGIAPSFVALSAADALALQTAR